MLKRKVLSAVMAEKVPIQSTYQEGFPKEVTFELTKIGRVGTGQLEENPKGKQLL